ncbi:cupin domain-containing protein [Chloroflexota bacterium]
MMEAKVTRLYTGPDGESHFDDTGIPIEGDGGIMRRSQLMKATGVRFSETDSGYKRDWHNASPRQLVIMLEGEGEIEVGDGTKHRFGPGNIVLIEDTTGRGHIFRVVSNQPAKTINVRLG